MDQLRSIAQENLISRGGLTSANAQDLIEQVNNLLTSINDLLISYTGEDLIEQVCGEGGRGAEKGGREGGRRGSDQGSNRGLDGECEEREREKGLKGERVCVREGDEEREGKETE
jgi:hypothetical protein